MIPPCATINGNEFEPIPDKFKDMHILEWRLVSPRIPFMKIFQAPRGGQKKITGNVVNVPCDTEETFKILPRMRKDQATINVTLKRNLLFKHHYMSQVIRPNKVLEAAKFVSQQSLFKQQGIIYDPKWNLEEEQSGNSEEINDDMHNKESSHCESNKEKKYIDDNGEEENEEDYWSEKEG